MPSEGKHDFDAIVETHAKAIEEALRRRALRQSGTPWCVRCTKQPAMGYAEQPRLCEGCFGEVVEIQAKAYGEGRQAFLDGKPGDSNPYKLGLDVGDHPNHVSDQRVMWTHWYAGHDEARYEALDTQDAEIDS